MRNDNLKADGKMSPCISASPEEDCRKVTMQNPIEQSLIKQFYLFQCKTQLSRF